MNLFIFFLIQFIYLKNELSKLHFKDLYFPVILVRSSNCRWRHDEQHLTEKQYLLTLLDLLRSMR